MAFTDTYREEHTELLNNVTKINDLISQGVETKASEIFSALGSISMKIKIHLKKEDEFLYPRLIDSGNEQVKKTAEDFKEEMSGILTAYMLFAEKYITPKKISENSDSFKSDFGGIVSALGARIEKEDSVLYKLADENL